MRDHSLNKCKGAEKGENLVRIFMFYFNLSQHKVNVTRCWGYEKECEERYRMLLPNCPEENEWCVNNHNYYHISVF